MKILHLQEWLKSAPAHLYESAEKLVRLNVRSLEGDSPLEFLAVGLPNSERRNDGRLRDSWLKQYAHTQVGGWWVSGLDPLDNWEPMTWGRFKPDQPRQGWDKENQCLKEKLVKYESPPKTPNRITYLRVTLEIWEQVSTRYNVPMPEHIAVTSEGEALGFWHWVSEHPEIPILFTEGEKKAFSLLLLGFVAISLPGIWCGCIKSGESFSLHPDLMPLAQKGRKFVILFDYETKPDIKQRVFYATLRLGKCIERVGCICEVALLPGQEKGVDDWLVVWGKKANQAATVLIADAWILKNYQYSFFGNKKRGLHKYTPNVLVNVQHLSDAVKLPESGLIILASDVKTGKTKLLEDWRKEHPEERFLNNGHLVNLLRNLSNRLKTEMYNKIGGGNLSEVSALSITSDSLYKMANNLQAYECVFIDEACQNLTHLLMSKTLKKHRAEVLDVLEYLVYTAKLVVLADAHIDDVTIDFFRSMRPQGEEPFIIKNQWKSGGRECYWYTGDNSSALVAQIHATLLQGKKIIVVSDSKRFIKKLERSLQNPIGSEPQTLGEILDEEDKPESEEDKKLRIWSIHSENSGSPENQIFIEDITNAVKDVDALLASPSLGTGADICGGKGEYHFDVIFGAFHATTAAATDCVQQLWRYRPDVQMHVWVAPRPPFGYQESNPWKIKQRILQKNEMTAFLIRIDRETGKRGAEKDQALDARCQIEAQRNWSINNLRQDLRSLLEEMGNTIIPVNGTNEQAKEVMKAAGEQIDEEYCQLVAAAADIDRDIYDTRQNKDYLEPEKERPECEKFRIRDTYGVQEVTPELVELDDNGKLIGRLTALEGILAEPGEIITDEQGRNFVSPPTIVRERDLNEREWLQICTDWRNESTAWFILYELGLREILLMLLEGQEVCGDDPIMQELLAKALKFATQIKAILNLTIPPDASATWVLGTLLNRLSLATDCKRKRVEGETKRFYSLKSEESAFALQVLAYRNETREEKERKRKEQQEKNAAHAAWIQSQYGDKSQSQVETANPDEFFTQESGVTEQTVVEQIVVEHITDPSITGRITESLACQYEPTGSAPVDELIEDFIGCHDSFKDFTEIAKYAPECESAAEKEELVEAAILYSPPKIKPTWQKWWNSALWEVRDFWKSIEQQSCVAVT